MQRKLLILLALVAVLWQGIAGASVQAFAQVAQDAEHAALHWDEVGHHHHDDGSYHQDDSIASVVHVAMDGSNANAVVDFGTSNVVPVPQASAQPLYLVGTVPYPYIDPLHRPPRSLP